MCVQTTQADMSLDHLLEASASADCQAGLGADSYSLCLYLMVPLLSSLSLERVRHCESAAGCGLASFNTRSPPEMTKFLPIVNFGPFRLSLTATKTDSCGRYICFWILSLNRMSMRVTHVTAFTDI